MRRWLSISAGIALLSAGSCTWTDLPTGRAMLEETFDQGADAGLAKILVSNPRVTLAKGAGPDGSDAIRVAYIGYERGSLGVVLRYPLGSAADEATLSYDVRFDQDFQWTRGGKLPGLGPEAPLTGGAQRIATGWSARIMFKSDGRCATYLYDQDETKKWGVGHATEQPVFEAGRWHHVTYKVKLNDPGKANGVASILIDGREVVKSEQVEFRGTGGKDTRIQKLLFSTFHGGNDPSWSPVDPEGRPTTIYAYFDNVRINEGF